jgi:sugar O-acyltransferase (sialic acid O-acetyltransferase NeuD family)
VVVAFTANKEYIKQDVLMGLPIVPFEEIENNYNPQEHHFYAAITYGKLNEIRSLVCDQIKNKGYGLASYISSKAFVWKNVKLGEHVFIFENNVVQPFVEIGNNIVLWSGNHIGHHSKIGDNCFISSHVVVSGWCNIGKNCFIGVNSTIANNVKIGDECWISHGSIIGAELPNSSFVKNTSSAEISQLNKKSLFKILSLISKKRQS